MVRAAAHGVIDFRHARPGDRQWWRYLHLLLNEVERDGYRQVVQASLELNLALVSAMLDDAGFKGAMERARADLHDLGQLSHPWLIKERAQRVQDEAKQARDLFKLRVGDFDSPEYKAKFAAWLKRMKEDDHSVEEDTLARIDRAKRDYEQAKAARKMQAKKSARRR